MRDASDEIVLGITNDHVALWSHLIHFWQNEEEFERGVHFLELGIVNEPEYCVLFGHDEANQRVLAILRKTCGDLDRVLQDRRLVILRRESSLGDASKYRGCICGRRPQGSNRHRVSRAAR